MEFAKYFAYDETSPSKLTRIAGVSNGNYTVGNIGHCGVLVKEPNRCRWRVTHFRKTVMIHLIVWELHHGKVPDGMAIDHINGDPSDNTISNLRLVNQVVNCRNRRKSVNNKTTETGVQYTKDGRFRACWYETDGKSRSKSFSVNKYGEAEAFRLACEHRRKVISELNAECAGYTERHGT